jgi:Tfp pilus assembly protein PilO
MKLSSDKRNKLIIVVVATVTVIGLICYFVIGGQRVKLKELADQYQGNLDKQRHIKTAMINATKIDAELAQLHEKISASEEEMASGDLYSWMYNTIKSFKSAYRVDIPQFSTVESGPSTLIYNFPYKQVKISVSGSAFFNDFGKFISDFENRFTLMRVENLELTPTAGAEKEADREKLGFKMDIIALVNASPDVPKK